MAGPFRCVNPDVVPNLRPGGRRLLHGRLRPSHPRQFLSRRQGRLRTIPIGDPGSASMVLTCFRRLLALRRVVPSAVVGDIRESDCHCASSTSLPSGLAALVIVDGGRL